MESPAPDSTPAKSLDRLETIAPALPAIGSPFWISVLLLVIFSFLIAVEFVSTYGFNRVSKIQRRIHEEYLATLGMRHTRDRGRTQVLLVGNSLLLVDVDLSILKEALPADFEIKRFAVEQTTYYDWLYGLRRIFYDGARPDVVVLALTARQMAVSEVLGEYFAHKLMSARDLARVADDLGLDRTTASNLLFGHVSTFYSGRADIRKWLLAKIFPGVHDLTDLMTQLPQSELGAEQLKALPQRLAALKETAAEYDVRLAFIAPPVQRDAYTDLLTAAGEAAGVPVIIALPAEALARGDFGPDGFHMSDSGAGRYTHALAPLLEGAIDRVYDNSGQAAAVN
jgi:hypothetical protein